MEGNEVVISLTLRQAFQGRDLYPATGWGGGGGGVGTLDSWIPAIVHHLYCI